jgi:hypothetical protein
MLAGSSCVTADHQSASVLQDMLMGVLPRRSKAAGGALLPLALRLAIFAAGSLLSFWVSLMMSGAVLYDVQAVLAQGAQALMGSP